MFQWSHVAQMARRLFLIGKGAKFFEAFMF